MKEYLLSFKKSLTSFFWLLPVFYLNITFEGHYFVLFRGAVRVQEYCGTIDEGVFISSEKSNDGNQHIPKYNNINILVRPLSQLKMYYFGGTNTVLWDFAGVTFEGISVQIRCL